VGDLVTCYAHLQSVGRTSMKISVEVWVQRWANGSHHRVTHGQYTYVAIDDCGKPHPVRRET
jgi:acyl-CoA thioesterase YciA